MTERESRMGSVWRGFTGLFPEKGTVSITICFPKRAALQLDRLTARYGAMERVKTIQAALRTFDELLAIEEAGGRVICEPVDGEKKLLRLLPGDSDDC